MPMVLIRKHPELAYTMMHDRAVQINYTDNHIEITKMEGGHPCSLPSTASLTLLLNDWSNVSYTLFIYITSHILIN